MAGRVAVLPWPAAAAAPVPSSSVLSLADRLFMATVCSALLTPAAPAAPAAVPRAAALMGRPRRAAWRSARNDAASW